MTTQYETHTNNYNTLSIEQVLVNLSVPLSMFSVFPKLMFYYKQHMLTSKHNIKYYIQLT